ncbi:Protein Xrp2 [Borealophlyctis nickersoniae]|nr:Protein Xrp2 [Borealophlyctis nickersoniae]
MGSSLSRLIAWLKPPVKAKASPPSSAPPTVSIQTAQKPKYNPADYVFSKLINSTATKLPGSIPQGMPINIEDCENSTIFVYDVTAQAAFLSVIVWSALLYALVSSFGKSDAMRDCKNLHVFLYVATQPIIESSSDVTFSCFRYAYPELDDQFIRAHLPQFTNEWSNIYDFNDSTGKNWVLAGPSIDLIRAHYKDPPAETLDIVKVDTSYEDSCIPCTLGKTPRQTVESCVVISFASLESTMRVIRHVQRKSSIVQVKLQPYTNDELDKLFGNGVDPALQKLAKGHSQCIVLEVNSPSVLDVIKNVLGQEEQGVRDLIWVSADTAAGRNDVKTWFGDVLLP